VGGTPLIFGIIAGPTLLFAGETPGIAVGVIETPWTGYRNLDFWAPSQRSEVRSPGGPWWLL
jgi:hypothetical protein